jgi:hypothetical protein
MSSRNAKEKLPGLFGDLASLKEAVRSARSAALAEAKETVGRRGFFRSSGAEFCAADSGGNKLSEGGVHFWDGTRRSFEADVRGLLEKHPQTQQIALEGTYSWAEKLSDFDTGDHDPCLSDWAVVVWRAGETTGGGGAEVEGMRQA